MPIDVLFFSFGSAAIGIGGGLAIYHSWKLRLMRYPERYKRHFGRYPESFEGYGPAVKPIVVRREVKR